MIDRLKAFARRLKSEIDALYLAIRHPGTPWYAKAFAAAVVAYALSPLDLIPDFVPVLGYLDDLLIVPVGLAIAVRLIPREVMAECRVRAADDAVTLPGSRGAATVIIVIWLLLAAILVMWLYRGLRR